MKILFVLFHVCVLVSPAAEPGTPEDELAIRSLIAARNNAFNRHEAGLNPSGYASDFDIVLPNGGFVSAKPDLRNAFQTVLKNARMTETVARIRVLRPDLALADGTFELTGTDFKYPKGLQTWLLVKENGRWVITAIRQMVPVSPADAAQREP